MPARATPFASIVAAAEAYRAALAEGHPAAFTVHGARSAMAVAAALIGGINTTHLRERLHIAASLGLDVPGWPPQEAEKQRKARLRYRAEDADYRAWLAGAGLPEAKRQARAGEVGGPPIPEAGQPPPGFAVVRNAASYDGEGNLLRQSVETKRDAGEVFTPPPGHMVKGVSALLDADGRKVVEWVKTREGAVGEGLVEALQAAFARWEGAAPLATAPAETMGNLHTIYPLADLHLGMYAWGRETAESYDTDIALKRARGAYRSLIAQAPATRSCTLLNLGDFFHANDAKAVTPNSGHRLDVDGRWPKVFDAGAELMLELVDLLAQRHEQVEVVILPGNHDPDAAAALRVALRLFYRRHERVAVDDGPGLIWYRRFGRCLWGATHGHTMKQVRAAGTMAADCPEDWGATLWRSFFTAHVHHERAIEEASVRIESFNTLASRDAYAQGGGWRAGHAVQAITYHADHGEVGRARVNVLAEPMRVRAGRAA